MATNSQTPATQAGTQQAGGQGETKSPPSPKYDVFLRITGRDGNKVTVEATVTEISSGKKMPGEKVVFLRDDQQEIQSQITKTSQDGEVGYTYTLPNGISRLRAQAVMALSPKSNEVVVTIAGGEEHEHASAARFQFIETRDRNNRDFYEIYCIITDVENHPIGGTLNIKGNARGKLNDRNIYHAPEDEREFEIPINGRWMQLKLDDAELELEVILKGTDVNKKFRYYGIQPHQDPGPRPALTAGFWDHFSYGWETRHKESDPKIIWSRLIFASIMIILFASSAVSSVAQSFPLLGLPVLVIAFVLVGLFFLVPPFSGITGRVLNTCLRTNNRWWLTMCLLAALSFGLFVLGSMGSPILSSQRQLISQASGVIQQARERDYNFYWHGEYKTNYEYNKVEQFTLQLTSWKPWLLRLIVFIVLLVSTGAYMFIAFFDEFKRAFIRTEQSIFERTGGSAGPSMWRQLLMRVLKIPQEFATAVVTAPHSGDQPATVGLLAGVNASKPWIREFLTALAAEIIGDRFFPG